MTAISAAIIELEAQRERLGILITELRRHERAIEASYPDMPPVKQVLPAPPTQKRVGPMGLSDDAIKLRKLIQASEDPLSTPDLVRMSRLPVDRVRIALKSLVANLDIRATGATSARRYSSVQPRPGAVAGTPAAPPVGPSPANGRHAQPEAFEVVWTGTKERNGDAPSILPPRERKP